MTALHLVRLPVHMRPFTEWALERGYLSTPPGDGKGKPRDADLGYALHALLTGLFGKEEAPRPFAPPALGEPQSRTPSDALGLWGYTRHPLADLAEVAKLADARLYGMVAWDDPHATSKPMPAHWPAGLKLRFELRACPVKRRWPSRPLVTNAAADNRRATVAFADAKKREMDAFQLVAARAVEDGKPVPARSDVYTDWLAATLAEKQGKPQAASLIELPAHPGGQAARYDVRVDAMRSTRLLRRPRDNGSRSAQWLTRPDVRFSGLLEVVEGEAFAHLLAAGVGRHCGFGFGMLLLKPA
mgnify:FL=1